MSEFKDCSLAREAAVRGARGKRGGDAGGSRKRTHAREFWGKELAGRPVRPTPNEFEGGRWYGRPCTTRALQGGRLRIYGRTRLTIPGPYTREIYDRRERICILRGGYGEE
ncbi:hypothetical protein Trydic_g10948 [Trypoxylus dichotomus]